MWPFYKYSPEENESCRLKRENEWLTKQLQFYKDKHSENDHIASLRMRGLRDGQRIEELNDEIKELKKKLNENRMRITLEQYEKDSREQITRIRNLEYVTFKQKDKLAKLEKELDVYKDFFTKNEVKVFVKDKEVTDVIEKM